MEDVFVDCVWVRWGHIATFVVPVSVHNVEVVVVICVMAMHCAQLGEVSKDLWLVLEALECSAGM